MNFKFIIPAVIVICLLPAVYYSWKATPSVAPSAPQPSAGPALVSGHAPSTEPVARQSHVPDDVIEERRAAARIEAIEAMEQLNDAKTLTALGNALADPNRDVKDAALEALSERKSADATEMLRRGLADPDPEFRIEVLEALAERGDTDSLRRAKSDSDEDVRERAAELLETAGN